MYWFIVVKELTIAYNNELEYMASQSSGNNRQSGPNKTLTKSFNFQTREFSHILFQNRSFFSK